MKYNYYDKYQLKQVINASGKMTILGVSTTQKSVQEAMDFAGSHFFEMSELVKQTGAYIANLLKVEDAVIVSSASAGIAQSVAALIGKGSNYHVYHPYEFGERKRKIVIPKGHNVDYGTAVEVMVAQGGGEVVEAGYANMCGVEHIEMVLTDDVAAILYVKSHHTVQKNMLSLEEVVEVANRYDVPLIIDAAAEDELEKYVALGADLVIFSGAKAIGGPSSGLVVGKKHCIEWVRLQSKGLGRSMKIGKEGLIGLTQGIEDYLKEGSESGEQMKQRLVPFIEDLNQIKGIQAAIIQDSAGRDIYRAEVMVTKNSNLTAKKLIEQLKSESPAVYTREYRGNQGIIEFDIRSVTAEEMALIVKRIKKMIG